MPRRRREYRSEPTTPRGAPADALDYFDAARLCNLLSEREGIPAAELCYQPGNREGVLILKPDYLKRRGYRLPTLPEWEFAARAGTTTDRYFGQKSDFIDSYAWHAANSDQHTQAVGGLRPNDFGLFDVIGNVLEWCSNPKQSPDSKCDFCLAGTQPGLCEAPRAALRGGAFPTQSRAQSVVNKDPRFDMDAVQPHARMVFAGFRLVKNEL